MYCLVQDYNLFLGKRLKIRVGEENRALKILSGKYTGVRNTLNGQVNIRTCWIVKFSDTENFGREPILAGERIINKRIVKYSSSVIKKIDLYN